MEYATTRLRTTAAASFFLLLALPLAWWGVATAEEANCPFAGKRPPLDEILKILPSQRPSLCKVDLAGTNLAGADLTGAHLTEADLTGANLDSADLRKTSLTGVKGLTCKQVRAAKTDRPTKLSDVEECD
jgi:hypothetical protein